MFAPHRSSRASGLVVLLVKLVSDQTRQGFRFLVETTLNYFFRFFPLWFCWLYSAALSHHCCLSLRRGVDHHLEFVLGKGILVDIHQFFVTLKIQELNRNRSLCPSKVNDGRHLHAVFVNSGIFGLIRQRISHESASRLEPHSREPKHLHGPLNENESSEFGGVVVEQELVFRSLSQIGMESGNADIRNPNVRLFPSPYLEFLLIRVQIDHVNAFRVVFANGLHDEVVGVLVFVNVEDVVAREQVRRILRFAEFALHRLPPVAIRRICVPKFFSGV